MHLDKEPVQMTVDMHADNSHLKHRLMLIVLRNNKI
jgi:hypothetical protein